MIAVGFLIAGEAGDRVASAIIHSAPPVVTEIGILLLWLSAIFTLYTGWDYMRAGLQYMADE
jgi:cardiolipin synthase